ncbi:MAG: GGDEF domain-containing protein [Spirochaetes bacterium]|nr:GGDEF domain-containing protein [Spirochaetota bacterium]
MISKDKKIQTDNTIYTTIDMLPSGEKETQYSTHDFQYMISRHSERINTIICENTQEYIMLISRAGTIIYANTPFHSLGYAQNDLINKNFTDYAHPDDADLINQTLTHCSIKNSKPCEYSRNLHFRLMTKSGDWIALESNVSLLPDQDCSAFLLIAHEEMNHRASLNDLKEWTDTLDTFVIKFDINGFIQFCNASLLKLGGISEADLYGKFFPDTKLLSHSAAERKKIIKSLNNAKAFLPNRIECTFLGIDKKPIPAIFNCQPVIAQDGSIKYLTGEGKTIIEEIQLRGKLIEANANLEKRVFERTKEIIKINEKLKDDIEKLTKAENEIVRLAAFPRESPHPILSSDLDGNIIYKNPAAQILLEGLGLDSPEDILPKNHKELIKLCFNDRKSYHNLESKIKGHVFSWTYNPVKDIKIIHLHGLNITDQKYFEEKLLHETLHDKLTGLPNRSFFYDELNRSIKISQRRNDYHFAVLFMDMGRFKVINDSLGHLIGDKVLIEVANRLSSCLRPEDTAARFGGDEFIILLNNILDENDPIRVAERIQKKLSMPLNIEGHEIFPSAGIGIALSSEEYINPEDILRDANTAMYKAKAEGLSRYMIFENSMHKHAVKLLELESNLQKALERKEFCIYYQPIVSIDTGRIVGFEALLRWQHPKSGLVLPENFVPMIEETGQIIPIGEWVIRKACNQLRTWHKNYPDKQHLYISVNLSAKQFAQPDLIGKIKKIFDDENLYPGYLNLEITESIIMSNYEKTNKMLSELRAMDVQIGIDDFGIGYSSLSSLHHFPIQTLKIDRSFITAMNNDEWTLVIPQTIISLGKNMEMDVIAEGIETSEQLNQLKKLGCGYAQGYYFSPPIDTKQTEQLIINDPEWK